MGLVSYVGSQESGENGRWRGHLISVAFFSGIVLSLIVLGTIAAVLGRLLVRWSVGFAIVTAMVSLLAGLAALFGPALRKRIEKPEIRKRGGISGAFVYGLAYTVASITTSAGPLMLVLTIAAAVGNPIYGAVLSLSYGIGRGLPFLLLGLFAGKVTEWLARFRRAPRVVEVLSGVALVALSVYFARLAQQLA